MKIFHILIFFTAVFFLQSCAPKVETQTKFPTIIKTDISATDVVDSFLNALKTEDFATAYDHIYIITSDKEGYVNRMRSLSSQNGIKLRSYKILGTQLFKDSAIVVAELKISEVTQNGVQTRTTRNRYDLAIVENRWKITKDSCIENCKESLQGESRNSG